MPNENLQFPEPDFSDPSLRAFLNHSARERGAPLPFPEDIGTEAEITIETPQVEERPKLNLENPTYPFPSDDNSYPYNPKEDFDDLGGGARRKKINP